MIKKLSLLIIILCVTGALAFLWVDRRVASFLHRRITPQPSAAYSDIVTIDSGLNLSAAQITEHLLRRRYREVLQPVTPGEFRISGNSLVLITREFLGADGLVHKPQEVTFGLVDGAQRAYFTLEPQVITLLGGGEVRANENVTLDNFPEHLRQAVLTIEDQRFFSHYGIDLEGLARALYENARALKIIQGGSSITQQLAKNLFFSPRRTLSRKILEILAAFSLERRLTKHEILEMYLNEIYLGQEGAAAIHGFAAAARTYFGKKIDDLSLGEAAMLAGIIKAPSYYSPRRNINRAKQRRDLVLNKMRDLGLISVNQWTAAKMEPLNIIKEALHARRAPFYMTALQQNISKTFNLEAFSTQGLSVYTGLDLNLQQCAESALKAGLTGLEKTYPKLLRRTSQLEGALVVLEPFSGKVKAWVGGRDYSTNQFDHAGQARRQIGSTIKPFLYLTALDKSLNRYKVATPITILADRPLKIQLPNKDVWQPENYDRRYRGDVTLRYALENSLNLPAVYTAQRFGFAALARNAAKFHLAESPPAVPALALGAADTSLLDLTAAYAALANGGIYVAPRLYIAVIDGQGQIVHASPISEQRVADENAVYVLNNILQGVVERGTGKIVRQLGFSAPAAAKTGTSNDTRDAWFIGFTPDLAAGVWIGYDDNKKLGLTGGIAAAPVWADFMKCSAGYRRTLDFVAPPGVVFKEVDVISGDLASPRCPVEDVVKEVFVGGTEPQQICRWHDPGRAPFGEQPQETPPKEGIRKRQKSLWKLLFD